MFYHCNFAFLCNVDTFPPLLSFDCAYYDFSLVGYELDACF